MNEIFPLASAAGMTVGLAVCALVIGLVPAMLFAVLESVKWRPVAWLATGIVTILRGLPEILVVLFIYFGSSQPLLTLSDGFTIPLGFTQIPVQMQIENFDVSPFLCGAIALSLLYAAYASQTLRGALKAVPQGQWESGQALGLSKAAIFFRLVMPQMWRHALPGLGNQWLVLLEGHRAGEPDQRQRSDAADQKASPPALRNPLTGISLRRQSISSSPC